MNLRDWMKHRRDRESNRELLFDILDRVIAIEHILAHKTKQNIGGFSATSKDNADMTTNVTFTATNIKDSEGNPVADRPFNAKDGAVFSLSGNTGSGTFSINADGTSAVISGTNEGDVLTYHCEINGVQVGTDISWTVGGTGAEVIGGFAAASVDTP